MLPAPNQSRRRCEQLDPHRSRTGRAPGLAARGATCRTRRSPGSSRTASIYPPAFHSANLYFNGTVDIRHFVIEPLFEPGPTRPGDSGPGVRQYCNWNDATVHRLHRRRPADGALRRRRLADGLRKDRVGEPRPVLQCADEASSASRKRRPRRVRTTTSRPWSTPDARSPTPACPPRHLQEPTAHWFWAEHARTRPAMACRCTGSCHRSKRRRKIDPSSRWPGQYTRQRSTLTTNNGKYFIDTTVSYAKQRQTASNINVFKEGVTYYLFLLFAKTTTQTYRSTSATTSTRTPTCGRRGRHHGPQGQVPGDGLAARDGQALRRATGSSRHDAEDFDEFSKTTRARSKAGASRAASARGRRDNANLATGGTCGCNASSPFEAVPDTNNAGENVCAWAQKDIDCPQGGCYGYRLQDGEDDLRRAVSPRPHRSAIRRRAST